MPTIDTSMQGKVCLLTGATAGIGKATALGLAQMGATVVMVSRDRARGEAAQAEIKTKSGNDAVDLLLADLSAQQSIRQLVENFQQRYTELHVLINNAGLFVLRRRTTVDGLEMTFAVDYLAPFLLTNLLLDVLKASAPARIVNVSSNSHEAGYIKLDDLQAEHHYRSMRIRTDVDNPCRCAGFEHIEQQIRQQERCKIVHGERHLKAVHSCPSSQHKQACIIDQHV